MKLLRVFTASAAVALLCFSSAVVASEEDWAETQLTITNSSASQGLTCQFLLAHWFEITLAPIAPGSDTVEDLSVRPRTGDVAIINSVGDHMAIERLTCGSTGAHRSQWADLSIDHLRSGAASVALGCRVTYTGADCQFE